MGKGRKKKSFEDIEDTGDILEKDVEKEEKSLEKQKKKKKIVKILVIGAVVANTIFILLASLLSVLTGFQNLSGSSKKTQGLQARTQAIQARTQGLQARTLEKQAEQAKQAKQAKQAEQATHAKGFKLDPVCPPGTSKWTEKEFVLVRIRNTCFPDLFVWIDDKANLVLNRFPSDFVIIEAKNGFYFKTRSMDNGVVLSQGFLSIGKDIIPFLIDNGKIYTSSAKTVKKANVFWTVKEEKDKNGFIVRRISVTESPDFFFSSWVIESICSRGTISWTEVSALVRVRNTCFPDLFVFVDNRGNLILADTFSSFVLEYLAAEKAFYFHSGNSGITIVDSSLSVLNNHPSYPFLIDNGRIYTTRPNGTKKFWTVKEERDEFGILVRRVSVTENPDFFSSSWVIEKVT